MDKRDNKTPRIRFPEFKEDWEHKKLSDLLQVSKKKNKDLKYSKEDVLSVSGQSGIVNQIKHMGRSYAGVSVHNYGVVEIGDIVYTKSPLKSNPYGIIKLNKGLPGIVSTLYAIYKVKEVCADGEFIEHYFSLDANTNRYLRPLVRKGAKNDMKINNEYVLHDRIFFPQKEEQKRIADTFNKIDLKVKWLKEKKLLMESYKKGVMQRIFSQEIRFKNDNGENFPEWETKKLEDIAVFKKGKGVSKSEVSESGTNACIRYGELYTTYNEVISNIKSKTGLSKEDCFLSKKNDVIIPSSGESPLDIATASCVMKNDIILGGDINVIRSSMNGIFLSYLLNTKMKLQIAALAQGSSVIHLYSSQLAKLKIPCPKFEEQAKIADFLSNFNEKIDHVESLVFKTLNYKKALLQQMFCY